MFKSSIKIMPFFMNQFDQKIIFSWAVIFSKSLDEIKESAPKHQTK